MTSKKPVKKSESRPVKTATTEARPAKKAPVGRKPFVMPPADPQPVASQQPGKQAVFSGMLNEPVKQTPPPPPVVHEPVPAPVRTPAKEVSGEELYSRIQFQAYILAERDGFKADPIHYWIQAERAVKAEIRQPTGA